MSTEEIKKSNGRALMNELMESGIDCLIVRTQFLPNKHANATVNIGTGKLNGDALHNKMSFWEN